MFKLRTMLLAMVLSLLVHVPVSADGIVRMSGAIIVGKRYVTWQPGYPSFVRSARIEGVVELEIIVNADGTVREVKVIRSDHLILNNLAAEAVKKWRYEPTLISGGPGMVPVAVIRHVTVEFRLVLVQPK